MEDASTFLMLTEHSLEAGTQALGTNRLQAGQVGSAGAELCFCI